MIIKELTLAIHCCEDNLIPNNSIINCSTCCQNSNLSTLDCGTA